MPSALVAEKSVAIVGVAPPPGVGCAEKCWQLGGEEKCCDGTARDPYGLRVVVLRQCSCQLPRRQCSCPTGQCATCHASVRDMPQREGRRKRPPPRTLLRAVPP